MSDLVNILLKPPQIVSMLEERKGSKSLPHYTSLSSEKRFSQKALEVFPICAVGQN